MLSKSSSIQYFLLACIPSRIILSILPLYLSEKYLFYYGFLLLAIASSFLFLYFTNKRLNADEGGGNTWWANFRLIHGLLYLCAAIYSIQGKKIASIPLLIDTFIGLKLFIFHRYLQTNKILNSMKIIF
jgi:hypothetical protein